MDASTTNPVIENADAVCQATEQVMEMTCGIEVTPTQSDPQHEQTDMIIALITIVGDVDWAVFIGLPAETATSLAMKFAGFEIPFDSPDMGDAVGEMTNILAGQVKALLDSRGLNADISLPSVMRAKGIHLLVQKGGQCLKTCYESQLGRFWTGVLSVQGQ
jgi:chemotaxis protein CheX